ncbi:MAG: transglycosylase family protein [Solirubrobacteraceae bacterium]|nr:transglycosylase family protein [Solirubrobacteraceae bacterium]
MPLPRRHRLAALLLALALPALLWAVLPLGASGQSQDDLQETIDSSKAREGQLADAAARLGRLEQAAARGVAKLQARQAEVQAELDRSQARLTVTETELAQQRKRLQRLRARLIRDRDQLADMLRATYVDTPPDMVTVLMQAQGFEDLMTRVDFAKRVQKAGASVVDAVRDGRDDAKRQRSRLTKTAARQREDTATVRRQRDAVAQMAAAVQARQSALAQARAARVQALRATRGSRLRAQKTLKKLLDAQAKAAVDKRGPGGPWAIPWAVVQCESGGQNLPPNAGAQASGYYQFIPSTWQGMGGSTKHAYQASKAEQDRLAARLWDNGRGARNWDCAAIVGII